MKTAITSTPSKAASSGLLGTDTDYDNVRKAVAERFKLGSGPWPLFTTSASDLFDLYLDNLPYDLVKQCRCNTCRHFFERYAGLVVINEQGKTQSAMWPTPHIIGAGLYQKAVDAVRERVESARVEGVFYSKSKVLGTPVTGQFTHYAVEQHARAVWNSRVQSADQAMAAKLEDYRIMMEAQRTWDMSTVNRAIELLEADTLYRGEKTLGAATFLREFMRSRNTGTTRNLRWRMIATAPVGFCRPRSSMIGTLLDDLQAGLPLDDVRAKFAAKMAPTQYLRPSAAPKSGSIDAAEKLVEQLGLEPAFHRRWATDADIPAHALLWRPKAANETVKRGVFANLREADQATSTPSSVKFDSITWSKFVRTVLPTAIDITVPMSLHPHSFVALTTAVNKDAPPILRWDLELERNPVAWYCYTSSSAMYPAMWNLPAHGNIRVSCIVPRPSQWRPNPKEEGDTVMFILEGCKDTQTPGLALFPECMRPELHGVRAVIEAHSSKGKMQVADDPPAAGITVGKYSKPLNVHVRSASGLVLGYCIDRWD